ncbi:hypothetical protein [Dawidia soli]|uniref:Uncharacterized protein n=1 Tax=Dawidia soli TaxID=2782352 RepID=A0AAP2DAP4_9BACT|nr:hypothetical protein [Dawidia soli]MBT1688498.1 hypothetical protein [Dawidia soli]
MNTYADKTHKKRSGSAANEAFQKDQSKGPVFQFRDNRPEAITLRRLQGVINNSLPVKQMKTYHTMAGNSPQVKRPAAGNEIVESYSLGNEGRQQNVLQDDRSTSFYPSNDPLQLKAAVKSLNVEWDKPGRPGFDITTYAEFYDNGGYTATDADVRQYTTGRHTEWKMSDDRTEWVEVDSSTNAGTLEDWSREEAPNSYQDNQAIIIDRSGFDDGDIPEGHFLSWEITARQSVHDRSEGNAEIAYIEAQTGTIYGTIPLEEDVIKAPAKKKGVVTRQPLLGMGLENEWMKDEDDATTQTKATGEGPVQMR